MSTVQQDLLAALRAIDQVGSFCSSGSVPAVPLGLQVAGLGPIAFPLTARDATVLKEHCEPAPYGKGEETLVDTKVRCAWHMSPDRFDLTNPDWQAFLQQVVRTVQQDLGLKGQKLESHLYDLLLYEKGSFFLPHRDSEKLDRMVGTLVLILPSTFEGGELIVRHDGQERMIDRGGDGDPFRIHYAAFYADCEHEIRPLRAGHRLCLVYNLTLATAKSKSRAVAPPTASPRVEAISRILTDWTGQDRPEKLAFTLDHQYTKDGLTWDALKGLDRLRAEILREAAHRAGCQLHLALVTYHESGEGEYADGRDFSYSRHRRRYESEDEDSGPYEMVEVFETNRTAEHLIDTAGHRVDIGNTEMTLGEDEFVDPEALTDVTPEEQFQGYTGNEGQPLDRWYRHAALLLWPNRRHHQILCMIGTRDLALALSRMVDLWKKSVGTEAETRKTECIDFARTVLTDWNPILSPAWATRKESPTDLLALLAMLGDVELIRTCIGQVLTRSASFDPGQTLATVCSQHGWKTFRAELVEVFRSTSVETVDRNVRLLEHIARAKPRKKAGWGEVFGELVGEYLSCLETIDQQAPEVRAFHHGWTTNRSVVLIALTQALITMDQLDHLDRLITHALACPKPYPLRETHMAAITTLGPWLKKNVEKRCLPLNRWLAACRQQLQELTDRKPLAPEDFRRKANVSCSCASCQALNRFLDDPGAKVHRVKAAQRQRSHVEESICQARCDLTLSTDKGSSPHTLVCTKNTASYQATLHQYHQDLEYLSTIKGLQTDLPR